ncbi:MAG: tRNA lysidine(34) synthetase TilS [Oscillospiraceae bacterium]|nr:tRNA lysidine(34) synthetase TilS [Oscillospiraceae bacterium]
MNELIKRVFEYSSEHEMLPKSGLLLVCVSGGADSMCLLEILREISCDAEFSTAVAHFNHELRGEESDRDEVFVETVCREYEIPCYSGRGNVSAFANAHGLSIEEAARDMRYDFFYSTAETIGAKKIATAHNKNDNAETMIMNLVRGAGSKGMSGIPIVRDMIVRPLLCVSRDEVMAFIANRELSYVHDSTNSLDIYARNKVRHKIIPLIKELNPRFDEAASMATELFRADESFISGIADEFVRNHCAGQRANAAKLASLSFSVSSRVIRKLCGGNLSYKHVKDVLALCTDIHPSAELSLPGMVAYREYEQIVFDAKSKNNDCGLTPIFPADGISYEMPEAGIKMLCKTVIFDINIYKSEINTTLTTFVFKSIDICGKMTVRSRLEGDSIKLQGRRGTKSLKKLFIEKRVPVRKRSLIPVISDDEGVLGIYKIGVGTRAIPESGEPAIMLIFEEMSF